MKKQELDNILKILAEEAKKIKKRKKKKFSPVAISPIRRPMGSIFYMDAGVSMAESEMLSEASIIKPITKKFDHLKWKLNDFQKQFLDDFINIPEAYVKDDDLLYASKRTGIPLESIKSIRNTYSDKKTPEELYKEQQKIQRELGLGSGDDRMAKAIEQDALNQMTDINYASESKNTKQWSMNPKPEFRNKSFHQMGYELDLSDSIKGNFTKIFDRQLPNFLYEWLLYYIEGSEGMKINESKLLNDFHSNKFENYKFIYFSFDIPIKESKAHAYDIVSSNAQMKELKEFVNKVEEFNNTFGTNFITSNQFIGEDGFLKVVLENAQVIKEGAIQNKKFINMEDTDIKKAISLGFYDQFTTSRSIT